MKKRLVLFAHYDPRGEVDEYVQYTLQALRDSGCAIIAGSNSRQSDEAKTVFCKLTDDYQEFSGNGFHWTIWKNLFLQKAPEFLEEFDEVLLINDSCFGPVFPLHEFFAKMDLVESDFYGLTALPAYQGLNDRLQSYFIGLRPDVFKSVALLDFFKNMPSIANYDDATDCEAFFCEILGNAGFKMAALCEKPEFYSGYTDFKEPLSYNAAPWLIRRFRIPFVKIKAFSSGLKGLADCYNKGGEIFAALKETESDYPLGLIRNYLNAAKPLSWQKNIPGALLITATGAPVEKPKQKKIAVYAHLTYESEIARLSILDNIPQPFDLYVSTSNQGYLDALKKFCAKKLKNAAKFNGKVMPNRGRDFLGWFECLKDTNENYDICLKYKDKKSAKVASWLVDTWKSHIDDCLLGSEDTVSAIIDQFETCSDIGVIFPVYPPHLMICCSSFDSSIFNAEQVKFVFNKLGINLTDETFTRIYPVGSEFWYRPAALAQFAKSDFTAADFPAEPAPGDGCLMHGLERAIPYIAQANKYKYCQTASLKILAAAFQIYEDYLLRNNQKDLEARNWEIINGLRKKLHVSHNR